MKESSLWFALGLVIGTASAGFADTQRSGANHHVGDDSFVARFHRAPTANDPEAVRLNVHLQYVAKLLASTPATKPELAKRRSELLSYLDDYIKKGTTPHNHYSSNRSPVFIDEHGNICAVGYLIERSVGRAVAEKIAKKHRFDFLETIAAQMPDVAAWIDSSGFSIDELASIQPGYVAEVDQFQLWTKAEETKAAEFSVAPPNKTWNGKITRGKMDGDWQAKLGEAVVGKGKLVAGNGQWQAFATDGKILAKGPFRNSLPHGKWTLFHPSGRVAAQGRFKHGLRDGTWKFFDDTDAHPVVSSGGFFANFPSGTWSHFAADGSLVATFANLTPRQWGENSFGGPWLNVHAPAGRPRFESHQGNIAGDGHYLGRISLGKRRLYVTHEWVQNETDESSQMTVFFDENGRKVAKGESGWTANECAWPISAQVAAKSKDLAEFHRLWTTLELAQAKCSEAKMLDASVGQQIEDMITATKNTSPAPRYLAGLLASQQRRQNELRAEGEVISAASDAVTVSPFVAILDGSMSWYVEWPHIDLLFIQLYRTLPGYT